MNIPVQRLRKEASVISIPRFEKTLEEIRQRAFALFEQRGRAPGHDLEDWLKAEREYLWPAPVELTEKNNEYRIRFAVPGFEAKEIHVTAAAGTITVEGEATHAGEHSEGEVLLTEFGARRLFRRLEMPSPIDIEKTTATLEKGILQVVAAKASASKESKESKAEASAA